MYIIRKCYLWENETPIRIGEYIADDFDAVYNYIKSVCPHSDIKEVGNGWMVTYEGLLGKNLSDAELVTYIIHFHPVQNIKEIDYE